MNEQSQPKTAAEWFKQLDELGIMSFNDEQDKAYAELINAIQRDTAAPLEARVRELVETNAVLKSQVENADVNWEQQKLIADQLRKQNAELSAAVRQIKEALQAHLKVNPRGGLPPRRIDDAISWVENDIVVSKMVCDALSLTPPDALSEWMKPWVDFVEAISRFSTIVDSYLLAHGIDAKTKAQQLLSTLKPKDKQ